MHRGYIKLWRRLSSNNLWTAEKFTRGQAWVDLIMIANHKPGYIRKRGIKIDLERGDIGFSEVELADRWKWSRGKVRRFLKELCSGNDPELTPKTIQQNKNLTSCYHINKYNTYQGSDTTNKTANGQQTDSKRYRNNNDKNDNKNKYTSDSVEYGLANYLFQLILKRNPKHKMPNLQTWSKHIDLTMRIDKRKPHEIKSVIAWSQQNHFWQNNILSTDKLRKQFDKLYMEMEKDGKFRFQTGDGKNRGSQREEIGFRKKYAHLSKTLPGKE